MHLPLRAQGATLTDEEAKILDDEFFLSNPLSHFSSRVSMLLKTARSNYEANPENETGVLQGPWSRQGKYGTQVRRSAPQRPSRDRRVVSSPPSRRSPYPFHLCTSRRGAAGWRCEVHLAGHRRQPNSHDQVIEANKPALDADPRRFLQLLFQPGTVVEGPVVGTAETAVAWANHAVWLLTSDELSINAAHNKLKHGLATSARGDVRIELITMPPNEDGTIPTSAFGGGKSIPLFDRPMLTYLSRPPKELRQGLEAVSLRVDLPVVLAETWMMANVYAAMFHIAAREHYGESLPEGVAPYPTLVVGRLPEHIIGGRPLGYRSAVTLPPDGMTAPRLSGVAFFKQFWPMTVDFESKTEGVVVDG
ncbi:hypothetical protein [Gordonia paraffinivorans]|uniref:hypothetical protein n=1 Tax=Gordonia paraffinivorans TaxID=175628 RepID=UPI0014461C21|nr:hypothetical protein [Gordonia paraffinivorans]